MPLSNVPTKGVLKIGQKIIFQLGFNVYENPGKTSPIYDWWESKRLTVQVDAATYGVTIASTVMAMFAALNLM